MANLAPRPSPVRDIETKMIVEIVCRVNDFFRDYEKSATWLNTPNLNFGNLAPLFLIGVGRGHKVLAFIKDAREGNLP